MHPVDMIGTLIKVRSKAGQIGRKLHRIPGATHGDMGTKSDITKMVSII